MYLIFFRTLFLEEALVTLLGTIVVKTISFTIDCPSLACSNTAISKVIQVAIYCISCD
jgi:hypothetical protein